GARRGPARPAPRIAGPPARARARWPWPPSCPGLRRRRWRRRSGTAGPWRRLGSSGGLHLQAPGVQQRLGVATVLLLALEHQVQRGLVGLAGLGAASQGLVELVA